MTWSLFLLVVLHILITIYNHHKKRRIVDEFFLVMTPYVIIIVLNNLYFTGKGFTRIEDEIIGAHTIGMILFFIGTVIAYYFTKARPKIVFIHQKRINESVLFSGQLEILGWFFACFVFIGKVLLIREYGLSGFITLGDEIKMASIFNHAELIMAVLAILLFEYYIIKKKKRLLILVAVSVGLIFTTFIKYHVISLIICFYIFTVIRHPKYAVKLGVATVIIIIVAYVGNYFLGFLTRGVKVGQDFYINHLWGYIAGGTINISNVESFVTNRSQVSIVTWVLRMITSLPSMFTSKLLGAEIVQYPYLSFPMFSIGASYSNVISILGSAFFHGKWIPFSIFMLIWGWICGIVYNKTIDVGASIRMQLAGCVFLAYNMLSFFSSFFVLSTPWETIVWAIIVPSFFARRIKC